MKKLFYLTAIITLTACSPTEANYRKSYETAKAHVDQTAVIEGSLYESIQTLGTSGGIISNGDTIPMITVPVKLSASLEVPNTLTKYNIAVGQFKQRFNAKSLMNRVQISGFPDATIVQNSEPLYYVIVPGASTPDESAALYRKVVNLQDSISFKAPYPLILTTSSK
jgi:hypothetical protein